MSSSIAVWNLYRRLQAATDERRSFRVTVADHRRRTKKEEDWEEEEREGRGRRTIPPREAIIPRLATERILLPPSAASASSDGQPSAGVGRKVNRRGGSVPPLNSFHRASLARESSGACAMPARVPKAYHWTLHARRGRAPTSLARTTYRQAAPLPNVRQTARGPPVALRSRHRRLPAPAARLFPLPARVPSVPPAHSTRTHHPTPSRARHPVSPRARRAPPALCCSAPRTYSVPSALTSFFGTFCAVGARIIFFCNIKSWMHDFFYNF